MRLEISVRSSWGRMATDGAEGRGAQTSLCVRRRSGPTPGTRRPALKGQTRCARSWRVPFEEPRLRPCRTPPGPSSRRASRCTPTRAAAAAPPGMDRAGRLADACGSGSRAILGRGRRVGGHAARGARAGPIHRRPSRGGHESTSARRCSEWATDRHRPAPGWSCRPNEEAAIMTASQSPPPLWARNKTLVRRIVEEAWNHGRLGILDRSFAPSGGGSAETDPHAQGRRADETSGSPLSRVGA
jgi:hypothetical protein